LTDLIPNAKKGEVPKPKEEKPISKPTLGPKELKDLDNLLLELVK
jgi:hypothetical protein